LAEIHVNEIRASKISPLGKKIDIFFLSKTCILAPKRLFKQYKKIFIFSTTATLLRHVIDMTRIKNITFRLIFLTLVVFQRHISLAHKVVSLSCENMFSF